MFAFSFAPKTDAEIHAIQNRGLLPEGVYPFTVKEVAAQVSKSNNPMLKIRIGVVDKDGSERSIVDYLLGTEQMIYKLKHFCDTIGFEEEYAKGTFDPTKCLKRSGEVRIGVQKGNPKEDGSGFYPDKNVVKDYVKSAQSEVKKAVEKDPELSKDVPW